MEKEKEIAGSKPEVTPLTDSLGNPFFAGAKVTHVNNGYEGAKDIEDVYHDEVFEKDGILWVREELGNEETLEQYVDHSNYWYEIQNPKQIVTKDDLNISQEDIEFLLDLKHRLLTQDNRITDQPVFQVRVKERLWGMDIDTDNFMWMNMESGEYETVDPGDIEAIREYYESNHKGMVIHTGKPIDWPAVESDDLYRSYLMEAMGLEQAGYRDIDVVKQSCFTEEGAQWYINANGHNLNKPFIYAAGSHRNFEYQRVRKIIMNL